MTTPSKKVKASNPNVEQTLRGLANKMLLDMLIRKISLN